MTRRGCDAMNVLFLCTGNSARSILAEALLNELGAGRFGAYSAGSHPAGRVNPAALAKLETSGHRTGGLSSKSWDRFRGAGAPAFDVVITVCDNAAGESCPVWNGSPVTVHWGIADPAAVEGDDADVRAAFDLAYARLKRRIEAMLDLPLETQDTATTRAALQQIHARACESRDA